jgi:hypothetical protein
VEMAVNKFLQYEFTLMHNFLFVSFIHFQKFEMFLTHTFCLYTVALNGILLINFKGF